MNNEAPIIDVRRDYLVHVLSRTKRKDYENYVVNAVWQRLQDPYLQPETQRYVRRENGYALIDLYFPALNIGIECDEAYHLDARQKESDKLRESEIARRLNAVQNDADYLPIHIRAFGSYEQMEYDINQAVKTIKQRKKELNPDPWMPGIPPWDICRSKGCLAISDGLAFRTISDVYRSFGRETKRMQRCYFSLHSDDYFLWCPKLGIERPDGQIVSAAFGITNTLSPDGKYLYEKHDSELDESYDTIKRVTFAQGFDELGHRAYRFIGIFEKLGLKEDDCTTDVYKRVATELDLRPWINQSVKD